MHVCINLEITQIEIAAVSQTAIETHDVQESHDPQDMCGQDRRRRCFEVLEAFGENHHDLSCMSSRDEAEGLPEAKWQILHWD